MAVSLTTVTPSEVFAAIAYAKKKDAADKHGDGAFRVKHDNLRPAKNDVRYAPFQILKKGSGDKWDFVGLNLKFMNLNTVARILPAGHPEQKITGVRLTFKKSASTYNSNNVEEKYGEAKLAIYAAFMRHMKKLINSKTLNNTNTNISSTIQTKKLIDKVKKIKDDLEDPLIRVEIPFKSEQHGTTKVVKADEPPKCEIYDATKKLAQIKPGQFPFQYATIEDGPLTYTNIGKFITPGSSVSGVDSMDSICLSNMGLSLPSKATLLIIKHSPGFKPDASVIFPVSEHDNISGAAVIAEEIEKTIDQPASSMGDVGDLTMGITTEFVPDDDPEQDNFNNNDDD